MSIDSQPRTATFSKGRSPPGCVVQCTCSMACRLSLAKLGRLWWLLVDRTNTETIAQKPKHAPMYTA